MIIFHFNLLVCDHILLLKRCTIAGHQMNRYEVLSKLISDAPDLVRLPNSKGENILLFLVQTVGRQQNEQHEHRQTSRSRKSASTRKASTSDNNEPDMPEHDLEPPKFARKALEKLLNDWNTVRAMIMTGHKDPSTSKAIYEDQAFLSSQSGTALIDRFTHCLLLDTDMLDTLLNTLIRQIKLQPEVAKTVARRFVRSVIRVFVAFNIELAPGQAKKRSSLAPHHHHHHQGSISQPMGKCKRVFQGLINIAVEELCETANALLAPVRMGIARPTAPFNLSTNDSDLFVKELFSAEPLMPKTNNGQSGSGASSGLSRGRTRTRSLTVENLRSSRSTSSNVQAAQVEPADVEMGEDNANNSVSVVQLAPNNPPPAIDSIQQEFDNDDSMDNNVVNNDANDEQNANNDMNQDNDDQQSDMDLDYLAESESDSETETEANYQSGRENNANANNDNTGGNQNGVFFSDEDTGESSHGEEDESEAGETDEQDGDEFSFGAGGGSGGALEEPLVPRGLSGSLGASNDRTNLAPQSMQWAIRPRPKGRPGASNGGGFIYQIDPSSLRRSTSNASAAVAVAAAAANGSGGSLDSMTMSTTAAGLARAFGIVIRTIADLLSLLQDYGPLTPPLNRMLDISYSEALNLQILIESILKPNWDWLMAVLDSTEAQLRFGSALANSTDPNQPGHPLNARSGNLTTARMVAGAVSQEPQASTSRGFTAARSGTALSALAAGSSAASGAAAALVVPGVATHFADHATSRRDFLSYALSLMRAHNSEHSDSLPILDVASMKHIAYVFDALIYYIRSANELDLKNAPPITIQAAALPPVPMDTNNDPGVNDDTDENTNEGEASAGRRHVFFQRSDSTLCLGCPPPDPFASSEPIPLAEQPQLLQPNARREDLFGSPKQPLNSSAASNPLSVLPTKLGLSTPRSSSVEEQTSSIMRSVSPTTVAATCDTASVRSLDTEINEPQDLSMSAASSVSSEDNIQQQRSFTSPKKAFMMREAASRASSSNPPSALTSSASSNAPEVLVVATSDCQGSTSNEVTVETTTKAKMMSTVPHDVLLGRWRLTLDLFGRVFVDDVGLEPGSIISELGGFPVKEAKFRKEMEKLRNSKTVDLTLFKLDRDRNNLLVQSFKEFNTHFAQNQRRSSSSFPPMVVNRVKVTFLNEPGEGSGVARGFYTALAEAILTNAKVPNLESAQAVATGSSASLAVAASKSMQYNLLQRLRGGRDPSRLGRSASSTSGSSGSKSASRSGRDLTRNLSFNARPFVMNGNIFVLF